jgi:hypothetical protein
LFLAHTPSRTQGKFSLLDSTLNVNKKNLELNFRPPTLRQPHSLLIWPENTTTETLHYFLYFLNNYGPLTEHVIILNQSKFQIHRLIRIKY